MLEINFGFMHGVAEGPLAIMTLAFTAWVLIFAVRYRSQTKTSKSSHPSKPKKSPAM